MRMTREELEAMTVERERHCRSSRAWIDVHFPMLAARWRARAVELSAGYGRVDGYLDGPREIDDTWFMVSVGARQFLRGEVPDGLWLVGTQNRGSAEYLVAMWREGARRLWFVAPYVIFMAPGSASIEKARAALDEALVRWDRGDAEVAYNGSFEPPALARRFDLSAIED